MVQGVTLDFFFAYFMVGEVGIDCRGKGIFSLRLFDVAVVRAAMMTFDNLLPWISFFCEVNSFSKWRTFLHKGKSAKSWIHHFGCPL